jgi:hypothetical protein
MPHKHELKQTTWKKKSIKKKAPADPPVVNALHLRKKRGDKKEKKTKNAPRHFSSSFVAYFTALLLVVHDLTGRTVIFFFFEFVLWKLL